MTKKKYIEINFRKNRRKLLDKIISIADEYMAKKYRITVRQMFYQLVARGIVDNTESAYGKTSDILKDGRLTGEIDWQLIVDRGRRPIMPVEFQSISHLIRFAKRSYRSDRWKEQEYYIEVLVEKDALAGILEPVTEEYHVSLLADKGYPSISSMYDLAGRIRKKQSEKKCVILYMGDHDPSGRDMVENIPKQMEQLGIRVKVDHIALTQAQISLYDLPSQYAKKSDSRYKKFNKKFGPKSCELDALDPGVLKEILKENIKKYLNEDLYKQAIKKEDEDKDKLDTVAYGLEHM